MGLTALSMALALALIALWLLSSAAVTAVMGNVLQLTLRPHATRLGAPLGLPRHATAILCQLCSEIQVCSFAETALETQQHTVALMEIGPEKLPHSQPLTSGEC